MFPQQPVAPVQSQPQYTCMNPQKPSHIGGDVYGPTGVTMPHNYYQYPQPYRQLPFLETLD